MIFQFQGTGKKGTKMGNFSLGNTSNSTPKIKMIHNSQVFPKGVGLQTHGEITFAIWGILIDSVDVDFATVRLDDFGYHVHGGGSTWKSTFLPRWVPEVLKFRFYWK